MDENNFKKILDEALAPVKSDITELKDIVENRLLPAVTELEVTVKSYADSYKINKHNIERLHTRLITVEDKLDVEVPEELKVPHFSTK